MISRWGDAVELSRTVTGPDIAQFVDAIGDLNPIHSDPAYAAATPFGEPIAPGVWTAGLVSAAIGTQLPGPGSIYLSQTLRFLRPVRFDDVITARVEVVEVHREKRRVRLATTCVNQHGEEVLAGEAWIGPPEAATRCATRPAVGGVLVSNALARLRQSARVLSVWCDVARLVLDVAARSVRPAFSSISSGSLLRDTRKSARRAR